MKSNLQHPGLKLVAVFCFLVFSKSIYAQNSDSISYSYNTFSEKYYVTIHGTKTEVGGRRGLNTYSLVEQVAAFPQLQKFLRRNLGFYENWQDSIYLKSIVNCYNAAIKYNFKIENSDEFFSDFQLLTREELKAGPSAKMLMNPQYIHVKTIMITSTNLSTGSTGHSFRGVFRYGNSPYYKFGSGLKNLRHVMYNDAEAMKYLNRYRAIKLLRVSLGLAFIPVGFAGFRVLDESNRTKFETVAGSALLVSSGAMFIISFQTKPKYKAKNIIGAAETYNKNLQAGKYGGY